MAAPARVEPRRRCEGGAREVAFAAAEAFRPMTPSEMAETRRRAARAMEGKGEVWWDPR